VALLFAPILFVAAVLYVAYPLLKEAAEDPAARQQTEREKRLADKDDLIDNLRDVEMDYRMGKLSQDDYQLLKVEYEQRAVEVFEKLQSLEKGKDGDS